MSHFSWKSLPAWVVAAFFVVGGIGNIFISPENAANYARWGYPDWFHYVTGLLELATAGLLAWRPTRLGGAALGGAVMLAAVATTLINAEYTHAIAPLVVLALCALVAWVARRPDLAAA